MILEEIWINPDRDEYLDDRQRYFSNADGVARIRDMILKKSCMDNDIFYGLFNGRDQLVGYLRITKYDNNWYQVLMSQIAPVLKGQGYGTFLYTYCVLNDSINLLSDDNLTSQSSALWNSIKRSGKFPVRVFDKQTNQLSDTFAALEDNNRYLFAGIPTGKSINETLCEINQKYKGERYVVWFGPTVVDNSIY